MANARRPDLGQSDRLMYELVKQGGITALHAPLYASQLRRLLAHGLIVLGDDRCYRVVTDPPPPPPPRPPAMISLVVRVPGEMLAEIDRVAATMGVNKSKAARALIAKSLAAESGVRRSSAAPAPDEPPVARRRTR